MIGVSGVKNGGYSRKSIVLWFKNEAVSKISVAGNDDYCFEIGDYEGSWDWKASEGMTGSKKASMETQPLSIK